jgi:hypothetical protein
MLEIQALLDSTHFDILILLVEQFQGDVFSSFALRIIDFAKTTTADSAEDGVAQKRAVASVVSEFHGMT